MRSFVLAGSFIGLLVGWLVRSGFGKSIVCFWLGFCLYHSFACIRSCVPSGYRLFLFWFVRLFGFSFVISSFVGWFLFRSYVARLWFGFICVVHLSSAGWCVDLRDVFVRHVRWRSVNRRLFEVRWRCRLVCCWFVGSFSGVFVVSCFFGKSVLVQ